MALPSIVQSYRNAGNSGPTGLASLEYQNPNTPGNLLYCFTWDESGTSGGAASISDSAENDWQLLRYDTFNSRNFSIWYCLAALANADNVVSVQFNNISSAAYLWIGEVSAGPGYAWNADGNNSATALSAGTTASVSATTAGTNDILLSFVYASGGNAVTAGSGWSFAFPPGMITDNILQYQTQTSAGAYAATATFSSALWYISVATFKAMATTPGNVITPISVQWESKILTMPNEEWFANAWVELFLVQIKGYVEFELWVAGMAGNYIQIGATHFQSNIGPFGDPTIGTIYYNVFGTPNTIANNFKAQLRYVRGPEITTTYFANTAHVIETEKNDGFDKGFQVLLKWTGVCGVRKIKFFYREATEPSVGGLPFAVLSTANPPGQDETGESNIVFESSGT